MKLKDIANYVTETYDWNSFDLRTYVTTDSLVANKAGREIASLRPAKSGRLIKFKKNDILVSNIRPYLKKIWFANESGSCSNDVLVFRANPGVPPSFLYSCLLQDQFFNYVMRGTKGSKMPRGDRRQIMEFVIQAPLSAANEIGSTIFNLQKKFDLLHKINRNLEAMARQLYDYWFVQFDFPDENGKPYKSSGGKMVWNEKLKREIPEGWTDVRLDSLTSIFTGKKDVAKVKPGSYKFFSCAPDPIPSNEYIIDGDAILVSGNGSYTGRVMFYSGKADLYQRTYGCIVSDKVGNIMPFLYFTMKTLFEPYHSGGKHGSSIPYIVLNDLAGFRFPYHPRLVKDFISMISSTFYRFVNKENDETELLMIKRDKLLPLLMNGQVSVMPTEVNCDLSHC